MLADGRRWEDSVRLRGEGPVLLVPSVTREGTGEDTDELGGRDWEVEDWEWDVEVT